MEAEITEALGVTLQYFGYSFGLYFIFELFAVMWRMFLKPTEYK